MKKQYLPLFAAVLMLGMAACSTKVEIPSQDEGWKVSVTATKGNEAVTKALIYDEGNSCIKPAFNLSDKICVYNKTTGVLDSGHLNPESDGPTAVISGTLTGSYTVGDEIELRYSSDPFFGGEFDYENQDGSFETLRDFGVATVSVTAIDAAKHTLTFGAAHFTNPYSIFRFWFENGMNHNTINFQDLWIETSFGKLVAMDVPGEPLIYYGTGRADDWLPRETHRDTPSSQPLWLSMCYEKSDNSYDYINFTATEPLTKTVYFSGTQIPDGGFLNSKFYSKTIEMWPCEKATITDTATDAPIEPTTLGGTVYDMCYYTYENPGSDISITGGTGDETCLKWDWNHSGEVTVRMSGDWTGLKNIQKPALLQIGGWGRINIVLGAGENINIAADEDNPCIAVYKSGGSFGEVVFQGNGSLKLNAPSTLYDKGIACCDGTGQPTTEAPNVHAAPGYTLTITGPEAGWFPNTSLWTYTVAPQ